MRQVTVARCFSLLFASIGLAWLCPAPLILAQGITPEERAALIALYNSTDGSNWVNKENWLGPPGTEGSWLGVSVGDGHVTRIVPPLSRLRGDLPPEVGSIRLVDLEGGGALLVCLRLVDDEGNELAERQIVNVDFGLPFEADLEDLFGLESDVIRSASLRVSTIGWLNGWPFSNAGISGDVLVYEDSVGYASSLPLTGREFRDAVFGFVANGSNLFTGLALLNPGEETARVVIEIFTAAGALQGSKTVTLRAGSRTAKLLTELIPNSLGQEQGYVRVRSDHPVVGQQLFSSFSLDFLSTVSPVILE